MVSLISRRIFLAVVTLFIISFISSWVLIPYREIQRLPILANKQPRKVWLLYEKSVISIPQFTSIERGSIDR